MSSSSPLMADYGQIQQALQIAVARQAQEQSVAVHQHGMATTY